MTQKIKLDYKVQLWVLYQVFTNYMFYEKSQLTAILQILMISKKISFHFDVW